MTAYPSFKTIGSAVGMSVNTVQNYVKSLEDKNFISTESTSIFRKTGEKVNGNLLYTIKPIAETIQTFHEKQMTEFERQNAIYRFEKKNSRVFELYYVEIATGLRRDEILCLVKTENPHICLLFLPISALSSIGICKYPSIIRLDMNKNI
ncbi:MAG: helix-turn-helix domain-containing protein [Clostridia bacterium]